MDRFNLDYLERTLPRLEGVQRALDVGAMDVNGSPRRLVESRGIEYLGCDVAEGRGVDVVVDVTAAFEEVDAALEGRRFDLVMSLNTLEHVFEPLKALDNMLALVRPGGYLLAVAPVVWELHEWPYDFYRLTPDFFRRYAETRGVEVVEGSLLLAARDTRRASADLEALPEEIPGRRLSSLARILYTLLHGVIAPGLKEAWPRTSVNVTMRKP